MKKTEFREVFRSLTGHEPLRWQERLFREHFVEGRIPHSIDLPTGLGKTMVMAIWLIARLINDKLPRRLVYVVDRRTVVDQASDLAKGIKEKAPLAFPGAPRLVVSTLRGQLADTREWSGDPSRPAIIVGTVDLIGSALLFSGYRSSYKRRPLEAGLLGQDTLLVLDEAHLSKPFEKLVTSIEQFQLGQGAPLHVVRMSATSEQPNGENARFTLQFVGRGNLTGEDANDAVTRQRFGASKRLTVGKPVESKKLNDAIATAAIVLASNADLVGKRIVIFVRKPDDAKAIAEAVQKHTIESVDDSGPKPKKIKTMPYAGNGCVEVLTGTMRGLERDELVEKPVFKERWLNGGLDPADPSNQAPVFLVSTSAGEVGTDLNADHLVCDAAPLDSMIQRLGRVNRRGLGAATVQLVLETTPLDKSEFDRACIAASKLFNNGMDVSPQALAELRSQWSSSGELESALTPKPAMVELTDILLDAWSMTSITDRMPGRPEVAPWLRGIANDLPQTTIAWRAELDLSAFDQLDFEDIEEWFDTHVIRTHESLSVPTSVATKWFAERWANLTDAEKRVVGARSIAVDRAGLQLVTVKGLIEQFARNNTTSIRNADLILPASFGGVERGVGLLDPFAPERSGDETGTSEGARKVGVQARSAAPDVADERERYRELVTTNEDGVSEARPIGSGTRPTNASRFVLELDSDDDTRVRLIGYVPKQDKPEWGSERQTLREHVRLVRKRLDEIVSRIDLPEPLKRAAELAADWHDHGKDRERWQRLMAFPKSFIKPNEAMGKSGGEMKRDPRGYRHEFGSLRELTDAFNEGKLLDHAGKPITGDTFDLAMHLIAAHHGRGRPHFPKGGFDPDCEQRSDEIHTDSIRRFAQLQRKYGWWGLAWLENLLRCADALASAEDKPKCNSTGLDGGQR